MAGIKQLRSWFYTTTGDSKIGNFWTRFVGGNISRPIQQTFENLTTSVPFFKEVDSAASVDSVSAIELKQGLVIVASDANAKSGSNTALGATGGTLTVRPSQLTTARPATNDFTVTTVPADGAITNTQDPFSVVIDGAITTRNEYIVNFKTQFVKWLLRRSLPAGGTVGQVISKVDGTDYNYAWAAPSGGGTLTTVSFGSSPNANGGSISGVTLTLQPADISNPGGVSILNQSFAGNKYFGLSGAVATSAATQTPSYRAGYTASYWNGSAAVPRSFEIYNQPTTTQLVGNLNVDFNSTTIMQLQQDGKKLYFPNTGGVLTFYENSSNQTFMKINEADQVTILGAKTGATLTVGTSINNTLIGYNTAPTHTDNLTNCIFVGNGIQNNITPHIPSNTYEPDNIIAIGHNITPIFNFNAGSMYNTVLIGNNVGQFAGNSSPFHCVVIGDSADSTLTSSNCVTIGANAFGGNNGITLGYSAIGASNSFVAGSYTSQITDVYFGSGITVNNAATAAGTSYTIHGSGAFGTDQVGGNITIAGGMSTGAGVGGSVIISTSPATGSSSTPNSLTQRLIIDQKGNVVIGTAALGTTATDGFFYMSTSAGPPTGVPTSFTGRVPFHYDSTNNKIYVYNGAWKATAALT